MDLIVKSVKPSRWAVVSRHSDTQACIHAPPPSGAPACPRARTPPCPARPPLARRPKGGKPDRQTGRPAGRPGGRSGRQAVANASQPWTSRSRPTTMSSWPLSTASRKESPPPNDRKRMTAFAMPNMMREVHALVIIEYIDMMIAACLCHLYCV